MNSTQIKKLVKKQVEFQQKMDSNTKVMYLALVEELGEYVASMGYSDWKKTVRDEANMDIELVDIAVFAMNLAYYDNNIYEPIRVPTAEDDFEMATIIIEYLADERPNHIYYSIFAYKPKLMDILTAKQALNQLRQDYGYKEGVYIKDWHGKEDNTYLEAFYGQSYEDIYNQMEEIYTVRIIGERLVNVDD